MNYCEIENCSIENGSGIRVALFVSGCTLHCKGCHNPQAWSFDLGEKYTDKTKEYILLLCSKPYIAGLSLIGGEVFDQDLLQLITLVKEFKQRFPEKNIWCYTGYEYEDLIEGGRKYSPEVKEFLSYLDVLVVGPFILELRDISNNNPWRGSTNQRIVDVKKSLQEGKRVLTEGIENNE